MYLEPQSFKNAASGFWVIWKPLNPHPKYLETGRILFCELTGPHLSDSWLGEEGVDLEFQDPDKHCQDPPSSLAMCWPAALVCTADPT